MPRIVCMCNCVMKTQDRATAGRGGEKIPLGAIAPNETFDYTVPKAEDTESGAVASFMRNKGARDFDGFDGSKKTGRKAFSRRELRSLCGLETSPLPKTRASQTPAVEG